MKTLKVLLFFLFITGYCHAQLNIYSALTIPDSLKKDANVVVREEAIKFIIKDINTARYEVHQVITILNEQGKKYLDFHEFSYEFRTLDDAEITAYDMLGIKTNSISKKSMTSVHYGEGLVPEGKITYCTISAPAYPVTVELNYSVKYNGLFSYPANYFQLANQSVQHAAFEVEVPTSLSFRYKMVNNNYQPQVIQTGNKEIYRWEVNNLPAFKVEKHTGSPDNYLPYVLTGPTKFQLNEYDGDMTSWKNFGDWYNKVYIKTTALKEERKQFYKDMVKDAATELEKAAILYNYLQRNMRYVSIQLGIGGLKPFPAAFVDEKKYGDCKALSNYLKSALDAVGIKSSIAIIEGSMQPGLVFEDFPAHYFNHVILCIPHAKDSTWLECTSTTLPFGELGPFTENRKAMLVTDAGGVLVNTPASNFKANTKTVHTLVTVDDAGGARVNARIGLAGMERDELLMRYHDLKEDEKRRFLISNMEWKQPDEIEISNSKDKANPYQLSASMAYEKIYSFAAGSKLFFESRLYPVFDEDIPDYEKRKTDYYFACPYQVMDTTIYQFTNNFALEAVPANKKVQFPFAQYSADYHWDANTHLLSVVTVLQFKERTVRAADYSKLMDFKKQVMADMNEKLVLKKL